MKIKEITCFKIDMDLAIPYTIAYETVSRANNLILNIVTDTGLSAWGCAAPDRVVTREGVDDVFAAVDDVIRPMLVGENPFLIAKWVEALRKAMPQKASALAMIDMALFDLLARKAELPLYQLLGGFRKRIETSITIGILPLQETLNQAEIYLKQGFSILKLKGGNTVDEDVEKVLKLREKWGYDFALRFDANQGYSVEQTIDFLNRVESANLEILEQPTHKTREDSIGKVTNAVSVPVMADESIATLKDTYRLAKNDRIDMVNIKLMKMGGIFESLHINSVAKAAGMEVMVGCLDESALGISAGLHFSLSRANIEYADLDGHLDLLNDPFKDLFQIKKGWLYPADSPGLGNIQL